MALRKRKPSLRMRNAFERMKAMQVIDLQAEKEFNYGGDTNPITAKEMEMQIETCNKLLNEYNWILAEADKKSLEIAAEEIKLGEMFTRVLAGGVSIFGVDSENVALLGGTKKSDRKRHATNFPTISNEFSTRI